MEKEKTYNITELNKIVDMIEDPRGGLPEEVFEFVTTLTPMVNVDLLIKNDKGEILLSWRDDYCGRAWHIPGGIIRYKELAQERIQKTALKELGTEVNIVKGPVEIHEIVMSHQIRGHFISMLYECSLPSGYSIPEEKRWSITEQIPGTLDWFMNDPGLVRGQMDVYSHLFK